ncbi:MAG: tRNA pseudouridine(55) synthase TruB [Ruminococcus sp.]|nr:tRNA pseudouridine(55) synthase TruB [Ruminococcus sp.]MBQ7008135.1 tRNA pseudouridine(55) synthase TruB [Ruminococcus sp.]
MNGILCMNKPQDFTSFDVIAKLRGILKIKRLGHAGTLDPMATGVLPVFVGTATKACDILPDNEKSYLAGFKTGLITDTQDITGKTVSEFSKRVTKEEIIDILPKFTGSVMQLPPMYSAVSVNGKRLYDLARQGIEVEREKREIFIDEIRLEQFNEDTQEGKLYVSCSKGTYIRTIINDIGELLGCGAVMTSLVRLSSGGFKLEQCLSFADVEKARDENRLEELIIPVEKVFSSLARLRLNEVQTRMYKNGVKLDLARVNNIKENVNDYAVYGFDGAFIGTAFPEWEKGVLKVGKNFF